ncbi:hypothetical protein [Photorhabdus khanii]|uniref:Uncharacterized protein n=1 Tax=Photorhabdus khanii subsp. guanajuatensis TaxID=2100166 RepID=A0A4R4IKQ6_9GAMM|nr:hypothetical protein [Photorhabdus khanii]TDB41048.1 hypothetical protein C5467_24650 [Photorhabdus khanii subsp. guanajuatensis]
MKVDITLKQEEFDEIINSLVCNEDCYFNMCWDAHSNDINAFGNWLEMLFEDHVHDSGVRIDINLKVNDYGAHVHAELMMQYAQDAMRTDEPWLLWEGSLNGGDLWENLRLHPTWHQDIKYRRKPEMITIGKVSFPKPVDHELKDGQEYWVAGPNFFQGFWGGYNFEKEKLEYGIIHLTQEAAQQHRDALIKINKGEF